MRRFPPAAFTLIELLVVISIIALLISILLPALSAARDASRTMKGLSNLRQIGNMVHVYGNDYDGYLPPSSINGAYASANGFTSATWAQLLSGNMNGQLVNNADEMSEIFRDPNAFLPGEGQWHYSAPIRVFMRLNNDNDRLYNLDRVQRGSEVLFAVDGVQNIKPSLPAAQFARADQTLSQQIAPLNSGAPELAHFRPGVASMEDPVFGSNQPNLEDPAGVLNASLGLIRWRQGNDDAANAGFLDGHAATAKIGTILNRNVRPDY